MSFLFSLPNASVCVSVLTEWIHNLQDVAMLDSACTNKKDRGQLLDILQLDIVVFLQPNKLFFKIKDLSFLKWLVIRQVQLNVIFFPDSSLKIPQHEIVSLLTNMRTKKVVELIMGEQLSSVFSTILQFMIETKLWELLPNIQKLTIHKCEYYDVQNQPNTMFDFSNLTELNIFAISVIYNGLELFNLFQLSNKLKVFSVDGNRHTEVNYSESFLAFLTNNQDTLESFTMNYNYSCDICLIHTLALHCKNLNKLDLKFNKLSVELVSALAAVAENCPLLEHINFSGNQNITDDCIISFATHCIRLKHVDISEYCNFSDHAIQTLSISCDILEYLDISLNGIFTYASIYSVLKHCKMIKTIKACCCDYIEIHQNNNDDNNNSSTEMSYPILTEPRVYLTQLLLQGNDKVDDVLLQNICQIMPNLTEITLTTSNNNATISDDGLSLILSNCRHLKGLIVTAASFGIAVLTSKTLVNLSTYNTKLEYLGLKIQPCSLESYNLLKRNCHKLEKISGVKTF